MTVSKATLHFGHRGVRGWLKSTLSVLVLLVVGFVAIATTDHTGPKSHAIAASAAQDSQATAFDAGSSPEERGQSLDRAAPAAIDKTGVAASTPRECLPEQGIVSECTFN